MENVVCDKCKISKIPEDFYNNKNRKNKLTSWCKLCMSESNKNSYKKNIKEIKKKHQEWRSNNKEHILLKRKEKRAEPESIRKSLFQRIKSRAKRNNLEFDLCLDDIQIPEYCPILGIRIEQFNISQKRTSPSMDRINPLLGYTKENTMIISWLANTMKSNATADELLSFSRWVLNNEELLRKADKDNNE